MKTRTMISAVALAGTLVMATGPQARAADGGRAQHRFGMVGFATGQTVRLNVLNALPPGPSREGELPPGPIRVRLRLLDGDGRLLMASRAELVSGQSTSLDLDFARLGVDARRVQVRALVDVVLPPGPTLPPGPVRDAGIASLEVFDNDTARTSLFVHPAVIRGFNPQPDPPRE